MAPLLSPPPPYCAALGSPGNASAATLAWLRGSACSSSELSRASCPAANRVACGLWCGLLGAMRGVPASNAGAWGGEGRSGRTRAFRAG